MLLDSLGVPHKPQKQLHGPLLKIIGFDVNANALTITLSHEKKQHLLDELNCFII
jgi:hypothetical protein